MIIKFGKALKKKVNDKKHSHNADFVMFGFQFQVFVGLLLALHFINIMKGVNVEGKKQDVEVKIGKYVLYCQAKSCYAPYPKIYKSSNTNWSYQLKNGLDLLFKDFRESNNKSSDYVYITNYPYPLGNTYKSQFGVKNYGYLVNYQSLLPEQKIIVLKHIKNGVSTCRYKEQSYLKDYINTLNNFLKQLNFINYNFVRHYTLTVGPMGKEHKYDVLYKIVRHFLQNNNLNPLISYTDLSKFWMNIFYNNGTNGMNCTITRKKLCISIYVLDMGHNSQDEIEETPLSYDEKKSYINEFKKFIEEYHYSIPFMSTLMNNVSKYKKKHHISGNMNSLNIDKFVSEYKMQYLHYFKLDEILTKSQELKLTSYALTDLLHKSKSIYDLLYGDIKNVD